jgi:TonB family protein
MNLQKALIHSFAAHIFLCGGAVAFGLLAQGGGALSGDIMMVALVGADKTGRMHAKRDRKIPAPVQQEVSLDQVPSTMPVLNAEDHNRSKEERARNSEGNADAASEEKESGVGVPSGGIGLVSPAQWQLVQAALERAKSYPRIARERGVQGVVRLKFRLRTSGEVESVEVVQSSGHEILDAASVRTVYRAGPLPYIQGWVEVPMSYVLK